MKAETQVVSVLIITGIVIALIGAAYFWSKPLIDKRSSLVQFDSAGQFMKKLDEKIIQMAKSCMSSCQDRLGIPSGMSVRVIPDGAAADNNSIILSFVTNQRMIMNVTVPLNTNNIEEVAPYGETHGVITLSERMSGPYVVEHKLHYRELDNSDEPYRGYKIVLSSGTGTGTSEMVIRYAGSDTSGTAMNGGPLDVVRIEVFVV
jgi:hypothetical protein